MKRLNIAHLNQKFIQGLKGLAHTLGDTYFPRPCYLCGLGAKGAKLCERCYHALPWREHVCSQCGRPTHHWYSTNLCLTCHESPPAYDRIRAVFSYLEPIPEWLARFKYHKQLNVGALMADFLYEQACQWVQDLQVDACLMPMPLHPTRMRARGFNQCLEMAQPLKNLSSLHLDSRRCIRQRATRPQAGLERPARIQNLEAAFALRQTLDYSHVLILEDVVTSGATVNALARLLKAEGADYVEVWTLAQV